MWRRRNERKIFGGGTVLFLEEKNRKRKKRKILHDGKYLSCEGEKPRRKGRKKNWKQIFFCGGEEKRRKRRRNIFGEFAICIANVALSILLCNQSRGIVPTSFRCFCYECHEIFKCLKVSKNRGERSHRTDLFHYTHSAKNCSNGHYWKLLI